MNYGLPMYMGFGYKKRLRFAIFNVIYVCIYDITCDMYILSH